jgi:hypothetical protein
MITQRRIPADISIPQIWQRNKLFIYDYSFAAGLTGTVTDYK